MPLLPSVAVRDRQDELMDDPRAMGKHHEDPFTLAKQLMVEYGHKTTEPASRLIDLARAVLRE